MRTIVVDVTAQDIAAGHAGDCGRCPVALAIARELGISPSAGRLKVKWSVWLYDGRDKLRWKVALPDPAREFIMRFDVGDQVYPLSFPLEIPAP